MKNSKIIKELVVCFESEKRFLLLEMKGSKKREVRALDSISTSLLVLLFFYLEGLEKEFISMYLMPKTGMVCVAGE